MMKFVVLAMETPIPKHFSNPTEQKFRICSTVGEQLRRAAGLN